MKDDLIVVLVAFLRARIDEDEQVARQAKPGPWQADGGTVYATHPTDEVVEYTESADHIARHDPARVLRDIDATRGVLAMYDQMAVDISAPDLITRGMAPVAITVLTPVMCHLARAWSDHPDYQADAWKPVV